MLLMAGACSNRPSESPLHSANSGVNGKSYFLNTRGDTIQTGIPTQLPVVDLQMTKPPRKFVLDSPKVIAHYRGEQLLGAGTLGGSIMKVSQEYQRRTAASVLNYTSESVRFVRKQDISFGTKKSNGVFRIRELNMDFGLTSADVSLPAQDTSGLFWYCHGPLISIDGNEVKEYVGENGEIFNRQAGLTMDRQNRMWMNYGWGNDLCFFDGRRLHKVADSPHEILGTDGDGNIVMSRDSAIFRLKGDTLEFLCHSFLMNYDIGPCYSDAQGVLYFPGEYGYFGSLKRDTLTTYNLKAGSGKINALTRDSEGSLWFACENGIFRLKDGAVTKYGEEDGLSGINAKEILIDGDDRLWISYFNGAVDVIADGQLIRLDDSNLRAYRNSSAKRIMYLDFDNRVWLCNQDGSFFILDETYLNTMFPNSINSGEWYGDLAIAENGDIWISGSTGLYKYSASDNLLRYYDDVHRAFNLDNEELAIAHDGVNLWVGSEYQDFVAVISEDSMYVFGREQGMNKPISDIEIDKAGVVWLGGPDGLLSFDGIVFSERLPWIEGHVNEMAIDHHGKLILAHSSKKIFRNNNTSWTIVAEDQGLGIRPWTVESADSGSLIAGSWENGLEYLDPSQSARIDRSSGLLNNNITSISRDPLDNIWIRSESGLNVINLNNLKANLSEGSKLMIDRLNQWDGLHFNGFSFHMDDVIKGDSLWFSNLDVIHIINYEAYSKIHDKLNLKLTDIMVNKRRVDYSLDTIEGISYKAPKPYTNIPSNLVLDYEKNDILFEFSNIDISAPHVNQYRFRIKELNKNWSHTTSVHQAEFNNMPPGTFTLEVQALGHGFHWSEPLLYRFEVLPPWYRTIWAYLAYILSLSLLIAIITRYRTRRLMRENVKLENQVSERTTQLETEKKRSDELLLNILPQEIAEELKSSGRAEAKSFSNVSVLFSDFVNFTGIAESLTPEEVVKILNQYFKEFDEVMDKYGIEKIKTIGDAYMAAGGMSISSGSAADTVRAALDIQDFINANMQERKAEGLPSF